MGYVQTCFQRDEWVDVVEIVPFAGIGAAAEYFFHGGVGGDFKVFRSFDNLVPTWIERSWLSIWRFVIADRPFK